MRTNPFSIDDAPCWLATQNILLIRRRLLKAVNGNQDLARQLPRLRGKDALTAITAFFSAVTCPLAEAIDALYTSRLLRSEDMVTEILRRMACAVGRRPLSPEIVRSVCVLLARQPIEMAPDGHKVFQLLQATWRLSWHQSTIPIRHGPETILPIVVLVTDEESGKVLSFRCVSSLPTSEELGLTLYDALVYSQMEHGPPIMHLRPPTCLQVQGSLSPEIVQIARAWNIDVTTVQQRECIFLRQWEAELRGRVLDSVHYLRIFDRACERTFGYAPFLQKQYLARWFGWQGRQVFDPAQRFAELRSLFPNSMAYIEEDGTLEWQGWHFRDMENILPYWAHETVMVRPSPSTEAMIWVYWNNSILCNAIADELRNSDGSYRPYWFPYPRLGE